MLNVDHGNEDGETDEEYDYADNESVKCLSATWFDHCGAGEPRPIRVRFTAWYHIDKQ